MCVQEQGQPISASSHADVLYWYSLLGFHSPTRESLYLRTQPSRRCRELTLDEGAESAEETTDSGSRFAPHIASRGANEVFINDCFLAYIASGMHFIPSSERLIFLILSHFADGK